MAGETGEGMSGQELVDEAAKRLRAWITPDGPGYYYPDASGRLDADLMAVLDRIEALEAEVGEAHTHFAIQEGRIRQAFEERDAAYKQAWDEAVAVFKPERARAERAEQKSAELAAVIAEALATKPGGFNDTPRLGAILRILSAADTSSALSAYTTRIREEAVTAALANAEHIDMEDTSGDIIEVVSVDQVEQYAARIRSEIPEGQADER